MQDANHDQKIILKPLSPREVCDYQIRMREKREQEKEKSEGINIYRAGNENKMMLVKANG